MLQALRRFVQDRLGVASRDDLVANRKTVERSEERLTRAVEKNILRLAKRLDRLMTAERNLEVQTEIVSNARAFIGTYGGLAYLATF